MPRTQGFLRGVGTGVAIHPSREPTGRVPSRRSDGPPVLDGTSPGSTPAVLPTCRAGDSWRQALLAFSWVIFTTRKDCLPEVVRQSQAGHFFHLHMRQRRPNGGKLLAQGPKPEALTPPP